jgi:hypothetical protein
MVRFIVGCLIDSQPLIMTRFLFAEPSARYLCLFSNAPPVAGSSYLVHPRSIVALARVAE